MKIEIKKENENERKNVYRNIFVEHISDFIELDIFIWISNTTTTNP